MKYTQQELDAILENHKKYLKREEGGKCASLRHASLKYAQLALADLTNANLMFANLTHADLGGANLAHAKLIHANLTYAELAYADLKGANLDFSCWPLWCGTKDVKIDRRLYLQLLAHLCAVNVDDQECKAHQQASLELASQSHRAIDLGIDVMMENNDKRKSNE